MTDSRPDTGTSGAPPVKIPLKHRDLTQGSIVKNLLHFSWPMIVMEATYMVSQIWDMYWVGRGSGSAAIAAVGVCSIIMMMVSTFDASFISGSRAMIARFIGAKDYESAKKVIGQAYLMGITWGLLVTLFGSLLIRNVLNLLGLDAAVVEEGVRYMRVLFGGWISLELLIMGLYSLQASGDSLTPMTIELVMRGIHLLLSPMLVMGYLFFPAMGISGAALANVISQTVGAAAGLVILFTGFSRIKLSLRNFAFVPNIAWRMIKIGLPSMVSMLQMNFSMLLLTKIIAPFGTTALAAQGIVNNIQNFIFTPNMGLGGGVAVLVGQNLGAKQPDRAVKSTLVGAGILQGFLLVCGAVILIWAPDIVSLFNNDPALITTGAAFLRITTISFLVMGLNAALMNCISGAGDTLPNMLINIFMIWVVQIPLTFLLANHTSLGVYGIRWALVISAFAGTIAWLTYFRSGRWKLKKV